MKGVRGSGLGLRGPALGVAAMLRQVGWYRPERVNMSKCRVHPKSAVPNPGDRIPNTACIQQQRDMLVPKS